MSEPSGGRVRHPRKTAESVELGFLLAVVGGFLDAYTFISRGGVFANAQTGNVVLFAIAVSGGRWHSAVGYLPPLVAFVAGVAVAETLRRPRMAQLLRRPVRAAVVLEMLVLAAVGAGPAGIPNAVVTVAVSFVAAIQTSTFRILVDDAYNTTMTTGNLRTMSQAVFVGLADHDAAARNRARRFALVIAGFVLGAVLGGLITKGVGTFAAWGAAALLGLGLIIFIYEERSTPR